MFHVDILAQELHHRMVPNTVIIGEAIKAG